MKIFLYNYLKIQIEFVLKYYLFHFSIHSYLIYNVINIWIVDKIILNNMDYLHYSKYNFNTLLFIYNKNIFIYSLKE